MVWTALRCRRDIGPDIIGDTCLQVTQLPATFAGKVKTKAWVAKLHNMPASHELDDADQRQLLFDLESSYNEFMASV